MHKIIEFNKGKGFPYPTVSLSLLNEEIAKLESWGYEIKSVTPVASFLGYVNSYTILVYRDDTDSAQQKP
jgi:hypothetical protein